MLQRAFEAMETPKTPTLDRLYHSGEGDFWVTHRKTLGNPRCMSILAIVVWLCVTSLNILCVDLTAGTPSKFIPNDSPDHIKPYDFLNISLIVIANIFGITLLVVHWRKGVRDSFRFTTELRLQGF